MRISITHPEIAALREAVEIRFGTGILTPRHFIALSQDICDSVREYLSETTLQRLWQYKKGYKTVAVHSLNVLSRYCGFSDWGAFCRHLHDDAQVESALFRGKSLGIDTLAPGALIRICWRPDRECIIRYLGGHRFEAVETHNAKLAAGDSFTCHNLQLGREAQLDNLVRGNADMSYVIGSRNGLTALEIVL